MEKILTILRNKILLANNKRKSFIRIGKKGKLPRLFIHEKYETLVKWILRILGAFGIGSSFISFEPTVGAIVAIGIFLVEQILEKSVFEYTSIFVQPLPNFVYKPEEWYAMVFGAPKVRDSRIPLLIGFAFRSKEYAKEFFDLLRSYNFNQDIDENNNICLSFIIEDKQDYSVYIYPSLERQPIESFRESIEKDLALKKYGKQHQQLVAQFIFCKTFPYGPNSAFNLIKNISKDDSIFEIKAYLVDATNDLIEISEIKPIFKNHIEIKHRDHLDASDFEYEHGKLVMKK